jgi:hypothetical protein
MKYHLIVSLCLCLLAACRNTPSETGQREALEARVMAVHDTAMAEMDQVFILRQHLKKLRDSLQTRQADTAWQHRVEHHLVLLEKADAGMMAWMHGYRSPDKEQAHDSTMLYLQRELKKIGQVKQTMDSSLATAQQIYKRYAIKK